MSKLAVRKKRVKRSVEIGTVEATAGNLVTDPDARIEAIQSLTPLGLQVVSEELERAVIKLAGHEQTRIGGKMEAAYSVTDGSRSLSHECTGPTDTGALGVCYGEGVSLELCL